MAQIPDWTSLPQSVPAPSYRRVQVDDSAAGVSQAIAGFGQTLQKTGDEQYVQAQQLADAKAQNAVEAHNLALQTASETMRQNIASGQVPYAQARDQYDQQIAKIPPPSFEGLRPQASELLQGRVQRNIAVQQFGIDRAVDAAQKQDAKDQVFQGLNLLGKQAGMPDADIADINARAEVYRPLARNAGIPEPVIDKELQDFKDRNWLNQATQRSMEAKESIPALKQLQHDLTDADGFYAGKLDTEKRNMVLRSVENDQIILQNRAQMQEEKREAKAQRTIGQIDEQISSGIPATPDMWDQWQKQTQGTSFADDFKQRLKDEDQVQQVLRQPIDQQQAFVQQRSAQLEQQGGTLRDRANLLRLQTAVNQNVNLMQKAPLLYAQSRTGNEVAPLDLKAIEPPSPIASAVATAAGVANPATPQGPTPQETFQQQIADRMATLKSMRTQYGAAVQPLPLLPQEATQLSSALESATPQERTQMLVGLRSAMGDDLAYQSAMRQIAPHSPVTAIAGSMVGSSAPAATPSWFSQDFAPKMSDVDRILRGEQLLNPASGGKAAQAEQESGKGAMKGGMPMPPDGGAAGLRATFGRAAGDVFRDRPELADAYYSVFKDAYASLLAEKGDMRGTGDPKLQDQALQIALGNRVQFGGNTVTVPPGMDPSTFPSLLKNAVAGTAQQLKAPPDWADRISGYGVRELGGLGSGRYVLTIGNQPVVRPDGKGLFTVDMRDQYLAARGAHRGTPDYRAPAERSDADQFLADHTK
jgi:hypothetical protein